MLEFLRRNQVVLSSGLFLVLSFSLLTLNRDGRRRVDPLGWVLLETLRWPQGAATVVTDYAAGVWSGYVGLVGVERENRQLRDRLRLLEGERLRTTEVDAQNQRLQKLLDFQRELSADVVTARVTGKDATGLFQTLSLDRGERDGVKPGMAVVCAQGVVGRIAQSSPHAARVLVIADHNSGVDALVQRTRVRGIVEGGLSEGGCSMKYIKRSDDVRVDDVVVTSGLDGIFPKGILVGRVSSVTRKDFGLFQAAEVAAAVDFSKLEEVLVVTSSPQEVNAAIDAAAQANATPVPTATAASQTPTPSPAPAAASTRRATPRPKPAPTRRATSPRPTPAPSATPVPAASEA